MRPFFVWAMRPIFVVCASVRRVTSPRLILLSSSHRRLGSLRADTGDAERAPSRERVVVPTERRRPRRACADRAVDTRALRFVCAVCRVTSPRLLLSSLHRRLGSVRADAGDAERAPSRERVVVPTERRRPRRACADRAVDTRALRFVCAVCRVTSPRLLLSSLHRRLGSVRADAGDAERAPSRERVVVPTERRRPRRACADRAVDTRALRFVCAVCRVTSPRLLLSSLHRRLGSVRADAGDAERAPSRERVVVPTERRRPRRACADRAVDTRALRFVCAVCRVTSPRLLLSSLRRRLGSVRADAGDAKRAPSRERVVVPTERRRPRRACADRAVDTRALRLCAPCVE